MIARELMTEHPALITASDTVATAANLMRTRGVGMLPVVQDLEHRHLVGILTDRDIVIRHVAAGHGSRAKVHEHMTRDPLATVPPSATVQQIAEKMTRYQVRRLPVVDELGGVIGVVAQADLAVAVGPTDPALIERLIEGISRPGALVP
jgi:CBS domain-containing protein